MNRLAFCVMCLTKTQESQTEAMPDKAASSGRTARPVRPGSGRPVPRRPLGPVPPSVGQLHFVGKFRLRRAEEKDKLLKRCRIKLPVLAGQPGQCAQDQGGQLHFVGQFRSASTQCIGLTQKTEKLENHKRRCCARPAQEALLPKPFTRGVRP